jgi:hypothetical protein
MIEALILSANSSLSVPWQRRRHPARLISLLFLLLITAGDIYVLLRSRMEDLFLYQLLECRCDLFPLFPIYQDTDARWCHIEPSVRVWLGKLEGLITEKSKTCTRDRRRNRQRGRQRNRRECNTSKQSKERSPSPKLALLLRRGPLQKESGRLSP